MKFYRNFKPTIKYHIALGLLSGYGLLDIVTFLCKSFMFRFDWFYNWYMKNHYPKQDNYRHVRFPLYRLFDKDVKYFRCKECNWTQFKQSQCNFCKGEGYQI